MKKCTNCKNIKLLKDFDFKKSKFICKECLEKIDKKLNSLDANKLVRKMFDLWRLENE